MTTTDRPARRPAGEAAPIALDDLVAHGPPARARFPLAWRIFLGTAAVVAAVLGGALLLTSRAAERAASTTAARSVAAVREQVTAQLDGRARGLLDGARVFVQSPDFRSLVAAGARDDALDQAHEAVERLGVTWVQITDASGVRLARSDLPDAPPEALGGQALIQRALAGEAVAAYGIAGDTLPLQAAAVRVEGATPGTPAGTFMAARVLDAAAARRIGAAAEGDVVFYVLPRRGGLHLAGSTLPPSPSLERAVASLAALAELPADSARGPGARVTNVDIAGEPYFALAAPLRSADGRAVGGVAVLRSRAAELGPFRELERTILLAGLAGLGLALLVSLVIARQITRPLARLVAAARRAGTGDYSTDIAVRSRDEVGVLAEAFQAMLADLREKQVLVEFARLTPSRRGSPVGTPTAPGRDRGRRDRGGPEPRRPAGDGATAPIQRAEVAGRGEPPPAAGGVPADVRPAAPLDPAASAAGSAAGAAEAGALSAATSAAAIAAATAAATETPPGGPARAVAPSSVDAIAAAAALRPGQRFAGRYDIRHMIGAGGAGVVFVATDALEDLTVALKVLRPDLLRQDAAAPSRLAREVEIARRLAHPNIVRVHALGESDGLHFITMEYAEGSTLRQLIDARGALPVPVVLTLAKQLCRALEHAHQQGVIHRDVKPHNLVVTPTGVLKVMDFGTARLVEAPRGLTESGVLFGTPAYMAPESLRGGKVDARADVYAAGVVLYESLVGHAPFAGIGSGGSPLVVLTHVLESPPRDPVELNPSVPRVLADVVLRALAKDPAERPQSAAALAEELAAVG